MATNGKPTTRFVVSYGNLDVSTAEQMLAPVFIAPRYDLHKAEAGFSDALLRAYNSDGVEITNAAGESLIYDKYAKESLCSLAEGSTIRWAAKREGSIVDLTSAVMLAKSPVLAINEAPISATVDAVAANTIDLGNINIVEFIPTVTSAVVGGEEVSGIKGALSAILRGVAITPGDVVAVTSEAGTTFGTIVDIEPTYADENGVSVIDAATGAASTVVAVDAGSMTSESAVSYQVQFIADNSAKAAITTLNGDDDMFLGTFTLAQDAAFVGNLGIKLAVSDATSIKAGDTFIVTATPKPIVRYNKIQLDIPMNVGESVQVVLGTQKLTPTFVELSAHNWNANDSEITVAKDANVAVTPNLTMDILQAELYMNYRELITDDALTLVSSRTNNIVDYVGVAHPDNPMGMMYACASRVDGAFFYMLSVDDNSDDAYARALEYVAKFENVYSFVPFKQSAAVRSAAMAEINKYSNPEVAQYKRLWVAPISTQEQKVYPVSDNMPTALCKMANGTLTLQSGWSEDINLVTAGLKRGDIARLYVGFSAETSSWKTVDIPINRVLDKTKVSVNSTATYNICRVEFFHKLSSSEYAESIAAEAASINSARVTLVASDLITWDSTFADVDKVYLAATLAAMRSALPPHAPMNELVVPGFAISDTCKWSDKDYEAMNDGGVWVVYNNSDNSAVTYHQITTLTDGTIAEEDSAVSNGDSVVRALRTALRAKGISGKANVSDALLSTINSTIVAELNYIQGIPYAAMYGSRILSHAVQALYVPASNRQSVVCKVNIKLPLPLQDGLFEFNLI